MTTATAKEPKTIEFFKAKLEKLRNKHNRILEEARKKGYSDIKTYRLLRYNDVERDIVVREVHDAGLENHILDSTIYFQSGSGYEGNHELGDALAKEFPMGVNDSESGQGFFYINEKHVPAVLAWLDGRVEVRQLRDKEKQEYLDAIAKGKKAVSVSKTVSDMLK
jgi:hypothetical protein